MVGLVLVSHSRALAFAVAELVRKTVGAEELPVAAAGGAGEDHGELGTDAVDILEAINSVFSEHGVLVLMDMGSAVLSAQTALDFLEEPQRPQVRVCAAPLVEGAIAAAVQARIGSPLARVAAAAAESLTPKQEQLGENEPGETPVGNRELPSPGVDEQVIDVAIENPHGLHLRPAATLLRGLAGLDAQVRVENLTKQRGPADAASLVEISRLQLSKGDCARFRISGSHAEEAVRRIRQLAAEGFGEAGGDGGEPPEPSADAPDPRGLFASSAGIAIGRPFWPEQEDTPSGGSDASPVADEGVDAEIEKLARGLSASIRALQDQKRVPDESAFGKQRRAMIDAYVLLLADPGLKKRAEARIREARLPAAAAWAETMADQASLQEAADDAYLRERAADFRELSSLLARQLRGGAGKPRYDRLPGEPFVAVCAELSPSLLDHLRSPCLQGVLQLAGGPNSHGSILARAAGIPCMGGAAGFAPALRRAALVAFDSGALEVWTDPDEATVARLAERRDARERIRAAHRAQPHGPAVTLDGVTVKILANVSSPEDTQLAAEAGADGIGLVRAEILYQQFQALPDEEMQLSALRELMRPWNGRPVVVRLVDVGADKPLPFLPTGIETNPFLGVRGVRLLLQHAEFLQSHLRALLRLAADHDISLMVPMVADATDMAEVRRALADQHRALAERPAGSRWPVPLGAMIETPAAALRIPSLAAGADFFSFGTNDLVQYLLCAERGHPRLAAYQDGLHPAVLETLRLALTASHRESRPVSICGELAAEPEAVPLLLGLGLASLSVAPRLVTQTKAVVRLLSIEKCRSAVESLLTGDAARGPEVRARVHAQFPELAIFWA